MFTHAGANLVNAELYNGTQLHNLEPRRLFPISGLTKYITLLDENGVEQAVIRNIHHLIPESREVIMQCLDEYYMVPKITSLIDMREKYGIIKVEAQTDRGRVSFDIRNRHHDIKVLYDKRVLFRDANDNRYEIPDYNKLDRHSRKLLVSEL